MPAGFRTAPDFIGAAEEARLVDAFADLPFKEFEFHGFLGKRRVVPFGFRSDYSGGGLGGGLKEAAPIPQFLLPLRSRAAAFAELAPERLVQALVTEYRPGAAIGWHRDRPYYADVIGVSLVSPCTFRLRKKRETSSDGNSSGSKFWDRAAMVLARRSIYLMRGAVREVWEHSIPAVDALRYSVTFRALR